MSSMSDDTKCWIAFWMALPLIAWAIGWSVVAYNRAYIEAGYSEVVLPGRTGTVWQKNVPQAEKSR